MTTPTNVTHVTLLVLIVTDLMNPTVSDVKIQDIYKMDTVSPHHVLPELTQKILIDLVNHVTHLVLNVLVDRTTVVLLVQKEPIYTMDLVLPLAQMVTSLTVVFVLLVTQDVALVTELMPTSVPLVVTILSYTVLHVLNHVQPDIMPTPPP